MNALTTSECRQLELMDIIEFKWLMAHDGHRVHVERLQNDPQYARQCLATGASSPCEAVRVAAARLSALLSLQPPAAKTA